MKTIKTENLCPECTGDGCKMCGHTGEYIAPVYKFNYKFTTPKGIVSMLGNCLADAEGAYGNIHLRLFSISKI